jgi:hypothetical protein
MQGFLLDCEAFLEASRKMSDKNMKGHPRRHLKIKGTFVLGNAKNGMCDKVQFIVEMD